MRDLEHNGLKTSTGMELVDYKWKTGLIPVCIVLCRTEIKDFRAFILGVDGMDEISDLLLTMNFGVSLTFEEAHGFFSYVEQSKYRE